MEINRPFTNEDWDITPGSVRRYIIQVEGLVINKMDQPQANMLNVSDQKT